MKTKQEIEEKIAELQTLKEQMGEDWTDLQKLLIVRSIVTLGWVLGQVTNTQLLP